MNDYWVKQDPSNPSFKDLIWSRPENKKLAGKLLIVGGNSYNFSLISTAYSATLKAGIGTCRLYLPENLRKSLANLDLDIEFGPSNKSGGFARSGLSLLLDLTKWSDGVLLAGDIGKNSETEVMLESFVDKYSGQLVIANDALSVFKGIDQILNQSNTILVLDFPQLQKVASASKFANPFTSTMGLINFIETFHLFSIELKCAIVTYFEENLIVSYKGKVSSTKIKLGNKWQTEVSAKAAVWYIQNPKHIFEALTSSVLI